MAKAVKLVDDGDDNHGDDGDDGDDTNDQNNNAGCDWDGGDCCGEEVSTLYCTVCECLEESEGWF